MSVYDGTVSPTHVGGVIIGAHSHINGSGAEPSGVVVTRHELEEVARYWYREQLDNDFTCFVYQQSGSYEWRLSLYSAQRLEMITGVLGETRMDEIVNEVISEYRTGMEIDQEAWRIFTSGTPEERDAWLAVNGAHALIVRDELDA